MGALLATLRLQIEETNSQSFPPALKQNVLYGMNEAYRIDNTEHTTAGEPWTVRFLNVKSLEDVKTFYGEKSGRAFLV